MTERRTLEQRRLDASVWAAQVRRGVTVAEIALADGVSVDTVYRDLRAFHYALPSEPGFPESSPDSGKRPDWCRLTEREIKFLHGVREEIRAADRAERYKGRTMTED